MEMIEREINRIRRILTNEPDNPKYDRLYAAQQALAWALRPNGFKSPFIMIMGTQEGSEDCLAEDRPPQSSDICARCGSL